MADDKPSVMQIILTLDRAGAQEVVRTLAEQLQANGCRVTVCAFRDGPMRAEIEKLGIPVEVLRRPRYSAALLPLFLAEMVRIRRELVALVNKYQVNVVQTHILQVLDFCVLTLRYGTPVRVVLWTMQNVRFLPKGIYDQQGWFARLKISGYRLFYRVFASRVDGFIAVSDQVRQAILDEVGDVQERVFVICNAVNLELFAQPQQDRTELCRELGLPERSRLILTAGRLTEQKGQRYLIESATEIVRAFPDAHLLVAGDGELAAALREQAAQTGVADHIHLLGLRRDVPRLLAAADVFVLPSLWEGLSVALLEAMAAAKPIVATGVSGTVQAMAHGQTGLLVPPANGQALAGAVIQFLSDPVRAQVMGQAAREYVAAHYSAHKHASEHLSLYRRLLSRNRARGRLAAVDAESR